MKKNKPYYLKMYREWMEFKLLPEEGLCRSLPKDKLLALFTPPHDHPMNLRYGNKWYWAYNGADEGDWSHKIDWAFTPLRQTILLFMAAMNNEL